MDEICKLCGGTGYIERISSRPSPKKGYNEDAVFYSKQGMTRSFLDACRDDGYEIIITREDCGKCNHPSMEGWPTNLPRGEGGR